MPFPVSPLKSAVVPEAAARPLRRFRPRAVPTLAALVAVALCVVAGNWQQSRMQTAAAREDAS